MAADDKHWAKGYILDPLTAPDPSEETGPGTHFRSTFAPPSETSLGRSSSGARPRSSAKNPFRSSAHGNNESMLRRASSNPNRGSNPFGPTSAGAGNGTSQKHKTTRARGSSLGERFPGDKSGQPLQVIRRESKRANRAPHLTKKHLPGTDAIDKLDTTPGRAYHHDSPYDAASIARNSSWENSPLAAVASSTEEALKATPRENILDAVLGHRPLDGVAIVPPGMPDRYGRTYRYEEGSNLMIDNGGNYKRWPGVDYHPDDIKGKGEPSYSIDRAAKERKIRGEGEGAPGMIEMQDRQSRRNGSGERLGSQMQRVDGAEASGGSGVKRNSLDGLKRRLGSLRRKKD